MITISFIYQDNKLLFVEIKKLLLDNNLSQKELAASLDMVPQAFTKLLGKKNFSFEDAKKILNAMEYDLSIDFVKK